MSSLTKNVATTSFVTIEPDGVAGRRVKFFTNE